MAAGIALVGIGSAVWLLAYYLPARSTDWSSKPEAVRSMRNRVGETIGRIVGPLLILCGVVVMVAAA